MEAMGSWTDAPSHFQNPGSATAIPPAGFEGRYCGEDTDGCRDLACLEGVQCTDNPAPAEGATCGPCPPWFSGTPGRICSGKLH